MNRREYGAAAGKPQANPPKSVASTAAELCEASLAHLRAGRYLDVELCCRQALAAVAHLAGALGKPVWTFLPCVPDGRWLLGRADSPWHPTARLFRQSESREWDHLMRQAREALLEFVG